MSYYESFRIKIFLIRDLSNPYFKKKERKKGQHRWLRNLWTKGKTETMRVISFSKDNSSSLSNSQVFMTRFGTLIFPSFSWFFIEVNFSITIPFQSKTLNRFITEFSFLSPFLSRDTYLQKRLLEGKKY